jgi:hypothetical protein
MLLLCSRRFISFNPTLSPYLSTLFYVQLATNCLAAAAAAAAVVGDD